MESSQNEQVNSTDINIKRRERLRALAENALEGRRIELIDQYKGGVATELYSIYLHYKDQLTMDYMQQIQNNLGTLDSFEVPDNSHPLLSAALAKGKEFAESFSKQHIDLFRDTDISIVNLTLDLLRTELNLRFNEKQQQIRMQKSSPGSLRATDDEGNEIDELSPSSSPRLSHEIDSPLRKQEQLREFLGLSKEKFEAIPESIREEACQNAIPKIELLSAKDSTSQSRLKSGGQTGMVI
jgi:hypothetical protein